MWNERIVSGEVDVFVASAGGGADETLLVIHGGPDWDHSYLRQPLDELAGVRRLLLPDLRGCGRSSRGLPLKAYHPDAAIRDLHTVLDAFNVGKADVLGFSFGGLLAQRMAVSAPARINKLIIASSSVLPVPADAFADWPDRDRARSAEIAVWSDDSRSGSERTRAAAVAGARANVWRAAAIPEYLRRLDQMRFSAEWARARDAGGWQSPRISNPVRKLTATAIPMLLLHGRYDMIFPAWLATETALRIPSARAVVLDDAGHMAHIDQPAAWLDTVETFL